MGVDGYTVAIMMRTTMDWSHFEDASTGKFKLKNLPPIRKPLRITDQTDLAGERDDFRGKTFEEGVEIYRTFFNDPYAFEPEVESLEDAFPRMSKEMLDDLAPFKQDFGDLEELYEIATMEERQGESLPLDDKMAKRAAQAGLVEPASEEGEYQPTEQLVSSMEAFAVRLVDHLWEVLQEYPEGYQASVWQEVSLTLSPKEVFDPAIKRHGGTAANDALHSLRQGPAVERKGSQTDIPAFQPKKASVGKQILYGLIGGGLLILIIEWLL